MIFEDLLTQLGYHGSPHFFRRGDGHFETAQGYGHIFRHAQAKEDSKRWSAEGVYGLRDLDSQPEQFIPLVYVCRALDESAADDLHRLVWNQDVVPYVLVHTPRGIKLYRGFDYDSRTQNGGDRSVIEPLTDFNRVQSIIALFHAEAIDTGKIWQDPHLEIDPSRRVYHRLLRNLRDVDTWLRETGGLKKEVSHALIGKYIYLRYLRDRDILSDKRLAEWKMEESDVFHRTATRAALATLVERLDIWLNGKIFPLPLSGPNAPRNEQIQRVAATFAGDDIGEAGWQLHFDFKAYDFSFIPIETLSLIYEQFLHEDATTSKKAITKKSKTKGRQAGAYYTPLPLVNFMLAELEERHPLKKGMRVFDPSCGSGAFLVQAYRRLIEKTYPFAGPKPRPAELRELLEGGIFGVDVDGDACQVTQLSLALTLLDYVDPPDLTKYPSFKLPALLEANIFEGNFFELESRLEELASKDGFDWLVGNPPWKQIKTNDLSGSDEPVWEWIKNNALVSPVGRHQVAQAFAWLAPKYLARNGECAFLVPAMALFEEPSAEFRRKFFRRYQVHTVANFANLAEVLFDGRSRVPAAALFYRTRANEPHSLSDEITTIYSPFVVNQEATCPLESGERKKLWSLVVNGSEIRTLGLNEVAGGSGLPWKLAMWGTPWDERLIRKMERKWPSLQSLEAKWNSQEEQFIVTEPSQIYCISEGLQLRFENGSDVEPVANLGGKHSLNTDALAMRREIFAFPPSCLVQLKKDKQHYALKGRVKRPLVVSNPPHVIVSAARNFAVYSDEFILVPARQIGITSTGSDTRMLKALSLYLSSDFAFYHQFFRSTHFGVKRPVATLEALRQIPIPLATLSRSDLNAWVNLHAKIIKCSPRVLSREQNSGAQSEFFEGGSSANETLLSELNELTAKALGLDERERTLVHDLVHVRIALDDGKRGEEAIRSPSDTELRAYCRRLKEELDDFTGKDANRTHRISVVRNSDSAMVEVEVTGDHTRAKKIELLGATNSEATMLRNVQKELLEERAQWVYFNRNLRIYRGHQTYLFKPLQRLHWTESAAMVDASDLIAETLSSH